MLSIWNALDLFAAIADNHLASRSHGGMVGQQFPSLRSADSSIETICYPAFAVERHSGHSVTQVGVCLVLFSLGYSICSFAQAPASDGIRPASAQLDTQREVLIESKRPADLQVRALLEKMAAAGVLSPTNVRELRDAYLFYVTLAGPPEQIFSVKDRRIPGPAKDIPIRLYYPRADGALPIWIFFHGGGFVTGSLETHDTTLRGVANRCGCLVVAVAYRLAPEHPFPAGLDDAYAATTWVAEHAAEIGGDPRRIGVGGDGAGGNLAAGVALMARDKGDPRLMFQLLIYPLLDATMGTASRIMSPDKGFSRDREVSVLAAYVPLDVELVDPRVSPVYAKRLQNLPSTLIVVGKDDPVRDEVNRYAERLSAAGVSISVSEHPDEIHGFFLFAGAFDAGRQAVNEIAVSLKQAFQNAGRP